MTSSSSSPSSAAAAAAGLLFGLTAPSPSIGSCPSVDCVECYGGSRLRQTVAYHQHLNAQFHEQFQLKFRQAQQHSVDHRQHHYHQLQQQQQLYDGCRAAGIVNNSRQSVDDSLAVAPTSSMTKMVPTDLLHSFTSSRAESDDVEMMSSGSRSTCGASLTSEWNKYRCSRTAIGGTLTGYNGQQCYQLSLGLFIRLNIKI